MAPPATELSSGLQLADNQKDYATEGVIVEIGDDVDTTAEIGDTVLYQGAGKFVGTPLTIDGDPNYRIVDAVDIKAVLG